MYKKKNRRNYLVTLAVCLVGVGDFGDEWVVGVGVGEHGANGEENFADGQRGRPLVPEDIETDGPVRVDVGVVDARGEVDLWRLERVIRREIDCEEEHASLVRRVTGSHDGSLPVEHVVADGSSRARRWGVLGQLLKLLLNSSQRHIFLSGAGWRVVEGVSKTWFIKYELVSEGRKKKR